MNATAFHTSPPMSGTAQVNKACNHQCKAPLISKRRVRPYQRIDARRRLSPPRSNSSRDDEKRQISGRFPPRKGHPHEKMPLSPAKATADASPNQGHRGIALRVQSLGAFLQLRPQPTKKRRSPDQPALSFLSFANAFLALFARGSSHTTSGAVRTCERLFGKARPPWSGSPSRSGRTPAPVDAPHLGRLSPRAHAYPCLRSKSTLLVCSQLSTVPVSKPSSGSTTSAYISSSRSTSSSASVS